jgi:hypothetical protein
MRPESIRGTQQAGQKERQCLIVAQSDLPFHAMGAKSLLTLDGLRRTLKNVSCSN